MVFTRDWFICLWSWSLVLPHPDSAWDPDRPARSWFGYVLLRCNSGVGFNLVLTCATVTTLKNRAWTTRMIWLAAQHDWISSWCSVLTQVWSLSPLLYCITNLNIGSTYSSKQAPEGLTWLKWKAPLHKTRGFCGWMKLRSQLHFSWVCS